MLLSGRAERAVMGSVASWSMLIPFQLSNHGKNYMHRSSLDSIADP